MCRPVVVVLLRNGAMMPIAPGATAKIKVGYNAAAEGDFEKSITITYNRTQTKQIKIKGTVWKAPRFCTCQCIYSIFKTTKPLSMKSILLRNRFIFSQL